MGSDRARVGSRVPSGRCTVSAARRRGARGIFLIALALATPASAAEQWMLSFKTDTTQGFLSGLTFNECICTAMDLGGVRPVAGMCDGQVRPTPPTGPGPIDTTCRSYTPTPNLFARPSE